MRAKSLVRGLVGGMREWRVQPRTVIFSLLDDRSTRVRFMKMKRFSLRVLLRLDAM
jgi:hypothetical protein